MINDELNDFITRIDRALNGQSEVEIARQKLKDAIQRVGDAMVAYMEASGFTNEPFLVSIQRAEGANEATVQVIIGAEVIQ